MAISVLNSLRGKRLLITGTTGFVGKALLEKLLFCVPDVEQLYLLIRSGSSCENAQERFEADILSSSVFDRLRTQHGAGFLDFCQTKVTVVDGELTAAYFGLDSAAYNDLLAQIDLLINSAASVNFREPLDKALNINTLCLKQLVHFSKQGGDIPLVQVSTCYVNGYHRGLVPESVLPPSIRALPVNAAGQYDVDALIESLQIECKALLREHCALDNAALESLLIDHGIQTANAYGWNDTYTFTKWLGEQVLIGQMASKQLTILRPAIIESALAEPAPGWIEGVKVADAIILAFARRRFSFFPARRKGKVDIIPVDMVVNGILLSAAELLGKSAESIKIYQCASSAQNPVSVGEYIDYVVGTLKENWRLFPKLTKAKAPGKRLKAVKRGTFLAAMKSMKSVLDMLASFDSLDKKLGEHERSIDITLKLATIYSFYTNPHCTFSNQQMMALYEQLDASEQALFSVDTRQIHWPSYVSDVHLKGLETYGLA